MAFNMSLVGECLKDYFKCPCCGSCGSNDGTEEDQAPLVHQHQTTYSGGGHAETTFGGSGDASSAPAAADALTTPTASRHRRPVHGQQPNDPFALNVPSSGAAMGTYYGSPSGVTTPQPSSGGRSRTGTGNRSDDPLFAGADIREEEPQPILAPGAAAANSAVARPRVFSPVHERHCCPCVKLRGFVSKAGELLTVLGRIATDPDWLWQPAQIQTPITTSRQMVWEVTKAVLELTAMLVGWTAVVYAQVSMVFTSVLVTLIAALVMLIKKLIEYINKHRSTAGNLVAADLGGGTNDAKQFEVVLPVLETMTVHFNMVLAYLKSGSWYNPALLSLNKTIGVALGRALFSCLIVIGVGKFFAIGKEHAALYRAHGIHYTKTPPQPPQHWSFYDMMFYMMKLPLAMLFYLLFGVTLTGDKSLETEIDGATTHGSTGYGKAVQENALIFAGAIPTAIFTAAIITLIYRMGGTWYERRKARASYLPLPATAPAAGALAQNPGVAAFTNFDAQEIRYVKELIHAQPAYYGSDRKKHYICAELILKIDDIKPVENPNSLNNLFTKDNVKELKNYLKWYKTELADRFDEDGNLVLGAVRRFDATTMPDGTVLLSV